MERALDARKEELRRKRPGAIFPNEPKFIWVDLLYSPFNEDFMMARDKYNKVLREVIETRKNHFFLHMPSIISRPENYAASGKLSPRGMEFWWQEMDRALEDFDRDQSSDQAQHTVSRPD